MPHLFCFGLGFTATNFATDMLAKGWRVSGTCRTSEKFTKLKSLGITPYIFDQDLPLENIWDLSSVTHILHSVPPTIKSDKMEDHVLAHHLSDIQNMRDLQWFGYLSTTGVYGDYQGAWVDENSDLKPVNDRSGLRVEAEKAWLATGLPVHIFRLSGIYGNGRSAFDSLKDGTARRINKEGQVFSRIHVEDIAQILQSSIARPNQGSIYNCADDEPAPQSAIIEYAAELMGVPPPPMVDFKDAEMSPMARSFYSSNRRVSNQKIKKELGVNLQYPDYKSGLRAIHQAQ